MVSDPDTELVERIAAGDAMAARTLMARHLPSILNMARRMLQSPHEAEDVAQDAFCKVWVNAGKWKPGQALFKTWLHRVALNLCYDRLRLRQHADLEAAAEVAASAPGPAQMTLSGQVAAHVDEALQTLPQRQKEAIVMVHYHGMSNIEAAEQMGLSVDALESLLARARRALRAKLTPIAPALIGAMDE
jgi:RNA polymerase sigma-70 factor (ECF subfamily)